MNRLDHVPGAVLEYKSPLFQDPDQIRKVGEAILKFSTFDNMRHKRCFYADENITTLRYAKKWNVPIHSWKNLPVLETLRDIVENITNEKFHMVFVTHYQNGFHIMKHTCIDEIDEYLGGTTAELTIGTPRRITFTEANAIKKIGRTVYLEHNSLLLVKPPTYERYDYSVPAAPELKLSNDNWKISLVFLQYLPSMVPRT